MKWYDRETIKLIERKKLGLLEELTSLKKINLLENRIKLLEREYFTLQSRVELIESKINLAKK